MTIFLGTRIPYQNMNCHPDRSEAKWRACPERSRMGTCGSLHKQRIRDGSVALSFAIPSGAEGSAVQRTFSGNVFDRAHRVDLQLSGLILEMFFDGAEPRDLQFSRLVLEIF